MGMIITATPVYRCRRIDKYIKKSKLVPKHIVILLILSKNVSLNIKLIIILLIFFII